MQALTLQQTCWRVLCQEPGTRVLYLVVSIVYYEYPSTIVLVVTDNGIDVVQLYQSTAQLYICTCSTSVYWTAVFN